MVGLGYIAASLVRLAGLTKQLKSRHAARQAYHALDLIRYATFLGVPLKANPRYYPQPAGGIELSAQAIIRLQQHYGVGAEPVRRFSYEVQRCIWETEEGDHCDVTVLQTIARRCGIAENVVTEAVVDRRSDPSDPGVKEWNTNHREAVNLGESLIPRGIDRIDL